MAWSSSILSLTIVAGNSLCRSFLGIVSGNSVCRSLLGEARRWQQRQFIDGSRDYGAETMAHRQFGIDNSLMGAETVAAGTMAEGVVEPGLSSSPNLGYRRLRHRRT